MMYTAAGPFQINADSVQGFYVYTTVSALKIDGIKVILHFSNYTIIRREHPYNCKFQYLPDVFWSWMIESVIAGQSVMAGLAARNR